MNWLTEELLESWVWLAGSGIQSWSVRVDSCPHLLAHSLTFFVPSVLLTAVESGIHGLRLLKDLTKIILYSFTSCISCIWSPKWKAYRYTFYRLVRYIWFFLISHCLSHFLCKPVFLSFLQWALVFINSLANMSSVLYTCNFAYAIFPSWEFPPPTFFPLSPWKSNC